MNLKIRNIQNFWWCSRKIECSRQTKFFMKIGGLNTQMCVICNRIRLATVFFSLPYFCRTLPNFLLLKQQTQF